MIGSKDLPISAPGRQLATGQVATGYIIIPRANSGKIGAGPRTSVFRRRTTPESSLRSVSLTSGTRNQ